jgi:hypothetical protein
MDKILSDIQTRIAEIIKEQKAKGVYGNDPIQKEAMCPLPRCANNPIPRSLPWLDLRRKGPALA